MTVAVNVFGYDMPWQIQMAIGFGVIALGFYIAGKDKK
jgi:hypothetical protein